MLRSKIYKAHIKCALSELDMLKFNVMNMSKKSIKDDLQRIINNIEIRAEQIK